MSTHFAHHFTPSPVLSKTYQALPDSFMDAVDGIGETPFFFGQHEEGQGTFGEAVSRVTGEKC